jgi:hypothetical protein
VPAAEFHVAHPRPIDPDLSLSGVIARTGIPAVLLRDLLSGQDEDVTMV